jgi:hypothetical protein
MSLLEKINIYYVAVIAFLFYCLINFFYFPLHITFPDEQRFINGAFLFSQNFSYGNGVSAWEMPLTTFVYGFFALFFDKNEEISDFIIVVRLFQGFLLIIQAFLLFHISLLIFKNIKIAKFTFLIVAFYPFFVFYQGLLLSETIFITLLIASFYSMYLWKEGGFLFGKAFYLVNIFFVLAVYTKATLMFLPPFLICTFLLLITKDFKRFVKTLMISVALYGFLMSPWWLRNYIIFDNFVPYTTSSGANFYLGNNEFNHSGGVLWEKDTDVNLVSKINSINNELERDLAYKKYAIDYIATHKVNFMRVAYLKFKRFWSVSPNAPEFDKGLIKWISIISFGPILLLSILSPFVNKRYFRELMPIYVLIIFFTIIHMVVISSLRYRLPIEPFMILIAVPVFLNFFKFKR